MSVGQPPVTNVSEAKPELKGRSPWLWVPSLYFAQGLPYVAVMSLSVVMYKRLGVSNTDIALYTSLLNMPWVIKPFWSPLVDMFKTKRQWIVVMQLVVALALAAVGAFVNSPLFFAVTLGIFWLVAFSSSTHDIAADGFYMLGLGKRDQAWYVGVRSTFFRLAMIVGSGLLVMLAGELESRNGLPPLELNVRAVTEPSKTSAVVEVQTGGGLKLIASTDSLEIPISVPGKVQIESTTSTARTWNQQHGFYAVKTNPPSEPSFWARHVSEPIAEFWAANVSSPLAGFLRRTFPRTSAERTVAIGPVGVVSLTLSPKPDREVVVSLTPKTVGLARFGFGSSDRGFKLLEGERFVFTPENWNQPFRAVVQLDPKVTQPVSTIFIARAGDIPMAWSITLYTLAGLFLAFCIWHAWALPHPAGDGLVTSKNSFASDFFGTLGSFFKKPGIVPALAFILLYRLAEAQSVKLLAPFLLDSRDAGGLGMTTSQVGFAYGTMGVLALTLGGILGGFLGARYGLKRMLPIMVCAIHIPNIVFVYLSRVQPENILIVNACVTLEQFGYGFGFTAYMLFLLHFADGEHKTAHYAICTGLMALGMMIPGFFSGWLQEILGYRQFFVWVMIATIPGFLVAFWLKLPKPSCSEALN